MGAAETALAIVSLIIAIIAFVVAVAQTTQQFAASAEGYRRCKEGIMGEWGKLTRRSFTLEEFRFKVYFSVPVLFVASPQNFKGPVPHQPIFSITGSQSSLEDTHCRTKSQIDAKIDGVGIEDPKDSVHTAEDEKSTWVLLLETLQQAEIDGREWDQSQCGLSKTSEARYRNHPSSLVVQLQERRRAWDEMPDSVKKPFATSTIDHLVQIAALLGMEWKIFDEDDGKLRANGNGLMLMSQSMPGLGLSVSFYKTNKTSFRRNRVIPCTVAIKQFPFGEVPTFLPDLTLQFEPLRPSDNRHNRSNNADQPSFLGRTFRNLNLSRRTLHRYLAQPPHIRAAITFKLLATLSCPLRVRGSNFSRIPNPTSEHYVRSLTFDPLSNMRELQHAFETIHGPSPSEDFPVLAAAANSRRLASLSDTWRENLAHLWVDRFEDVGIDLREAVHDALEECDDWLGKVGKGAVLEVFGAHFKALVERSGEELEQVREGEGGNMGFYVNVVLEDVASQELHLSDRTLMLEIWATLMVRMLLWGVLHDFSEGDRMILPPRLLGSRMPVYIL